MVKCSKYRLDIYIYIYIYIYTYIYTYIYVYMYIYIFADAADSELKQTGDKFHSKIDLFLDSLLAFL